jgi:hypothetical protein
MMNPNYRDMLAALSDESAEFLVVGAYAMAAHGYPRATGDMDIWIRPSSENAERVWRALKRFKAPMRNLTIDDLTVPEIVFQIGLAPCRIDVLTSIDGVDFEEAWQRRRRIEVDGQPLAVLSIEDLIRNKRASRRPKDQADAAWLESEQTES